ncbi:MAG TPA: CHASE3 domain-containing protein, partial [Polyangiaceae bacterium]
MPDAEDVSLSRRLTLAILVPVALLLLVGAILAYQITRMREEAALVDHTDRVIATSFEAVKQILDQESSFRGYLLTREPEFLEPFYDVNPRRTLRELAQLVSDNPRQSQRARNLADGYERWLAEVEPVMRGGNFELARALPAMQLRHRRMAATRQLARSIIEEEYTLRASRAKEAEDATKNAELAFFGCFFFAALSLAFVSRNQLKRVSSSYRAAFARERTARLGVENAEWVRQGEVELARALQGELSAEQIGKNTLEILVEKTGADVGAVYAAEDEVYRRCAAYGLSTLPDEPERFAHGEGLVGRAAAGEERIVKRDLPPEYLRVRSGTGEHLPVEVVVVPATVDGQVQAVLELGFLKVIDDRSLDLLDRVHDVVGAAMRSADYRKRLRDLLKRTQEQAEQLQTQQEELRVQNEELEEQSQALQEAQRRLELQQTELEQTNEDLKLHTDLLERRNFDLSRAQRELEEKAGEVARANQYKSEFLANMSHELRTPLNSSLILAKLLADNKDGNLKAEQVRYAETIYSAGNDLLSLINDILDLSKIEAGKMDVDAAPIALSRLAEPIARTFEPIAQQKKVAFSLWIDPALDRIETDAAKVQQILNNLLSNAFKFTERGSVELKISAGSNAVRFEVSDTGIGIPPDRQALIFDAFRQADGSIARRFGGTGLGLSISRDLA